MLLVDIELQDWGRILFGAGLEAGYIYEVILRTVFVYVLLMVSMRLMGKRMASQLSRLELAALVSLAAAIGVPVLAPEQGLMGAVIIAVIVVVSQKVISKANFKNGKSEMVSLGDISLLVNDGVLQTDAMIRTLISKERLKAQLRSEQLVHTGEVLRLFIEANGSFSLVVSEDPKPGLLLIPEFDTEFTEKMTETTDTKVCGNCGLRVEGKTTNFRCKNCKHKAWIYAVKRKDGME